MEEFPLKPQGAAVLGPRLAHLKPGFFTAKPQRPPRNAKSLENRKENPARLAEDPISLGMISATLCGLGGFAMNLMLGDAAALMLSLDKRVS
jgi:hypothetical protein